MPTTETRTVPTFAAALALAAALLLAGGCDGGIFGTGDGSSSSLDVPVDSTQEAPASSGDGGLQPETAGPDDADTDLPIESDVESPTLEGTPPEVPAPTSTPLSNALAADPSASAPGLRIVNAGSADVALASDADAPGRPLLPTVAAGTASGDVALPDGARTLTLGYPSGTPDDTVLDGSRTFAPLLLLPSSVTTLLVRDGQPSAPEVIALPTLIDSGDPGLALVRLVSGGGSDPDDGPAPGASYALVPDGANPGGVRVELGRVAPGGAVVADYVTVPAGDYRLESSGPGTSDRALSFEGGSVRTLVVLGSGGLLVVADGG